MTSSCRVLLDKIRILRVFPDPRSWFRVVIGEDALFVASLAFPIHEVRSVNLAPHLAHHPPALT